MPKGPPDQVRLALPLKYAIEDEAKRLSREEQKKISEGEVVNRAWNCYLARQMPGMSTFTKDDIAALPYEVVQYILQCVATVEKSMSMALAELQAIQKANDERQTGELPVPLHGSREERIQRAISAADAAEQEKIEPDEKPGGNRSAPGGSRGGNTLPRKASGGRSGD